MNTRNFIAVLLMALCLGACHDKEDEPENKEISIGESLFGGIFTVIEGDTIEVHGKTVEVPKTGETTIMNVYSAGFRSSCVWLFDKRGCMCTLMDSLECKSDLSGYVVDWNHTPKSPLLKTYRNLNEQEMYVQRFALTGEPGGEIIVKLGTSIDVARPTYESEFKVRLK